MCSCGMAAVAAAAQAEAAAAKAEAALARDRFHALLGEVNGIHLWIARQVKAAGRLPAAFLDTVLARLADIIHHA